MKMLPILAIIGTIVVTGCTSSQPESTSTSPVSSSSSNPTVTKSTDTKMGMMKMSPMMVDGTTATYEETATGASLRFRTSGNVVELRNRVDAMADMHNEHHSTGMMNGSTMMPASVASSLASDDGARLVFLPIDTADLNALRVHVRNHSDMMASGN